MTTTGSASPALLARNLITYPEPVALARVLTTLQSGHHHTTNGALTLIARRLGLALWPPARTARSAPSSPTHAADQYKSPSSPANTCSHL